MIRPTDSRSIRPFIGARDYSESLDFYRTLGFTGTQVGPKMTLFRIGDEVGFYLQDAYVEDWVDNTMVFLEVENPEHTREAWLRLDLPARFPTARISAVRVEDWGREFFLHDPSGILWHVGSFSITR